MTEIVRNYCVQLVTATGGFPPVIRIRAHDVKVQTLGVDKTTLTFIRDGDTVGKITEYVAAWWVEDEERPG